MYARQARFALRTVWLDNINILLTAVLSYILRATLLEKQHLARVFSQLRTP